MVLTVSGVDFPASSLVPILALDLASASPLLDQVPNSTVKAHLTISCKLDLVIGASEHARAFVLDFQARIDSLTAVDITQPNSTMIATLAAALAGTNTKDTQSFYP